MIITGIEIKGLDELCEKRDKIHKLSRQLEFAIRDLESYLNNSEIKLVEKFSGSEETNNNIEHDFGGCFIK